MRALRDAKTPADRKKIRYRPTPRPDLDVTTMILPEEREALKKAVALLQTQAANSRDLWISARPEVRRQAPWPEMERLTVLAQALTGELTKILYSDPRRVQRLLR